jgi:hypothetical protein
VAEELGMRPLLAHCHLGLGTLHLRTGKWGRAHEHLATATTMYGEMGMAFWLGQPATASLARRTTASLQSLPSGYRASQEFQK